MRGLVGRQALCMLLEPFDAEQFAADRLFLTRRGRATGAFEGASQDGFQGTLPFRHGRTASDQAAAVGEARRKGASCPVLVARMTSMNDPCPDTSRDTVGEGKPHAACAACGFGWFAF